MRKALLILVLASSCGLVQAQNPFYPDYSPPYFSLTPISPLHSFYIQTGYYSYVGCTELYYCAKYPQFANWNRRMTAYSMLQAPSSVRSKGNAFERKAVFCRMENHFLKNYGVKFS